jgi:hypothetical protein
MGCKLERAYHPSKILSYKNQVDEFIHFCYTKNLQRGASAPHYLKEIVDDEKVRTYYKSIKKLQ